MKDGFPRIKSTSKAEITSSEIKQRLIDAGIRSAQDVISRKFGSCKIHKGLYWRTEAESILRDYERRRYVSRKSTKISADAVGESMTTRQVMDYLDFTHPVSVAQAAKNKGWRRIKIGLYLKEDVEKYKLERQPVAYDKDKHITLAEVASVYNVTNLDSLRAILNQTDGLGVKGYILVTSSGRRVRNAYYDREDVVRYFTTRSRSYRIEIPAEEKDEQHLADSNLRDTQSLS